ATNRLETRWPRTERSAAERRERLSDREMKRALSTGDRPRETWRWLSRPRRAFRSQEVVSQTPVPCGVTGITLSSAGSRLEVENLKTQWAQRKPQGEGSKAEDESLDLRA